MDLKFVSRVLWLVTEAESALVIPGGPQDGDSISTRAPRIRLPRSRTALPVTLNSQVAGDLAIRIGYRRRWRIERTATFWGADLALLEFARLQ